MSSMSDKLFIHKHTLAVKKVLAAYSDLHRLAKEADPKKFKEEGKLNKLDRLIYKLNGATSKYFYANHANSLRNLHNFLDAINPVPTKGAIEVARSASVLAMHQELKNLGDSASRYTKIEVQNLIEGCGAVFSNDSVSHVKTHTTYATHRKEIGKLGSTKALIWARPAMDMDYKCWKAEYLTFRYSNHRKVISSNPCWIMKDPTSEVVYYHTDRRPCKAGLRRAISKKIAARIGG